MRASNWAIAALTLTTTLGCSAPSSKDGAETGEAGVSGSAAGSAGKAAAGKGGAGKTGSSSAGGAGSGAAGAAAGVSGSAGGPGGSAGSPSAVDAGRPDAGPADAAPQVPTGTLLDDIQNHTTKSVGTNKVVKTGWNQKDSQPNANWDGEMTGCPDPDAMVVPGTVDYKDGTWTMTGSGEGFMHGWDQGNLVYFEKRITGDFDFTAQATMLAPDGNFSLNGAAEAVLNVRDGLDYKAPTNSVIAGRMKDRTIFMGRFHWGNEKDQNGVGTRKVENKYWHWPAWPETWPKEPPMEWARISRRGIEFRAYVSKTGAEGDWQEVKNADTMATWYPFKLKTMKPDVLVGLVCSARNDRNDPSIGKNSKGCKDENSAVLKQSARCVFKNVTIVQK